MIAVRKALGLTQSEMAKLLGVTDSYISYIESGKKKMTDEMTEKLTTLGVNNTWLTTGEGAMFREGFSERSIVYKPTKLPEVNNVKTRKPIQWREIKLVPIIAQASFIEMPDMEVRESDMKSIVVADLPARGNYVAFEVDGDSMEPRLSKHDVVVCKQVESDSWNFLNPEKMYVVVTHDMVTIKMVRNEPETLHLLPLNKEYIHNRIPIERVQAVFQVVRIMREA